MESEPEYIITFPCPTALPSRSYTDDESMSGSETESGHSSSNTLGPRMNLIGAFGNKSSPNRIPNPGKKRITRDTLDGRLRKRKGKPGSRKHHRWENERRLGRREDELSDTGPQEDEMERYLFDAEEQNIFYQMFEDPSLRNAWEPFLDVTEEEHRFLSYQMEESSESEEDCPDARHALYSRAHLAFDRLTSEGRKSLVKYAYTDFLLELDSILFDFVQRGTFSCTAASMEMFQAHRCPETGCLRLHMKDSFHRLMAHSVSTFYNAVSTSEQTIQGKVVVVEPVASFKFTPHEKLVEYLHVEYVDMNAYNQDIQAKSRAPRRCRTERRQIGNALGLSAFSKEQNVGWVL